MVGALLLLLLPATAHAGPPENWIYRANLASQYATPNNADDWEKIAEAMEKQDYTRYSQVAASKVISKSLSPWRPTALEREVVYGWILKLRLDEWDDEARKHGVGLSKATENVGIAYRRLARVSSNPHLWSRLEIMRAMNVSEGSVNIGWKMPVREGLDLRWVFFVGSHDSRAYEIDSLKELYEKQTQFRKMGPVDFLLGFFSASILFTAPTTQDTVLDLATRPFNLEITDSTGAAVKSSSLEEMIHEERERVQREIDAQ